MTELKPKYPIRQPSDIAKTPVILEGLVIKNGSPIGPVRHSTVDGRLAQLWKGRVKVENVLQGEVSEPEVEVFFFRGDIPGSSRSIRLNKGERNIFFLRRDGTKLRTNNDRSANSCLLLVRTGPHLNFRREPGSSINQTLMDLLLTRGNGVGDRQMTAAIEKPSYSWFVGEEQVVKTLQRLRETETPLVKEAACQELLSLKHGCGQQIEAPAITIRNLTRPRSRGNFKLGDRIRTTLQRQPNQVVYRSSGGRVGVTDANGRFTVTETIRHLPKRTQTDVWLVGTEELSPAVSYVAGPQGTEGTIVTTAIGKPRDRYGMGISALLVTGDTVLTYSATLLDYRTGLYYDAREVDELYEDTTPIRTGSASGSAYAQQFRETKVKRMRDYVLQGGHYAVAALQVKAFANPMAFGKGSCFGATSNCQIMRLDGPANVANAAIFLGITAGDQTAVSAGLDFQRLDPESKAVGLKAPLVPVRRLAKAPSAAPVEANGLQTAIPKYMVLANFLLMIHGMEEKKLVSAFGLKWLTRRQLKALTEGASALTRELATLDARAQEVTATFRRSAQLRLAGGKQLPQVPHEICSLQARRTAAMVKQAVRWQTILGPEDELNFEAMLAYRFARADRLGGLMPSGDR